MAVLFPKIEILFLHGFNKIFNIDDIQIDLSKSLNILLGGNGLGKTTLLQCIIYALTGGTDDSDVEEIKNYRWNHTYFKGKVNDDAYVTISFLFGKNKIIVKRGFSSTRVLDCTIQSLKNDTVKNIDFETAIKQFGNYCNISDFCFIVNRLLYLQENRRSLLWDYNAQMKTLMIISDEIIMEKEYRNLRQTIKEKDSNKRRIHWEIGRIEKRISQKTPDKDSSSETIDGYNTYINSKKQFLDKLQILTNTIKSLYDNINKDKECRKSITQEISNIGDRIRSAEADYLKTSLHEYDEKYTLIFNNTLKTSYCPACNQKSESLKNSIQDRIRLGACLICGEPIEKLLEIPITFDIEAFNSQLNEKILVRNNLDVLINQKINKLDKFETEIFEIRKELSKLDYEYTDGLLSTETEDDNEEIIDDQVITKDYLNLCQEEKEIEAEIIQLTKKADDIYNSFINDFQSRYEYLSKIYSDLASEFLGLPVKLKYVKSTAKFVNMDYLVPQFDGIDRNLPESCSESQGFFLDIAFRMAIIALNKNISNMSSVFICETPENALDVSYIENVAKMFLSFMKKEGNLVLTNNLQPLGIAQTLIKEAKKQDVCIEIFDLLEYGKLSEIQINSIQLKNIRDTIFAEVRK